MEINKVADLIPYRNSLEALWDKEDFQPVKALWACLYKEAMDSLLTSRQTGSLAEQFKVAETAAAARVFNQMYYLPTLLKQMEDHMAEMEAVKLKAMGSQEPGGLAGVTNMKIGSYAESNLKTARTLEETLRERNDRRKGALDAV